MAIYLCLGLLASGLVALIAGNCFDQRRKAVHFTIGMAFVTFAALVMIASAIGSLWLYPLS